MNIRQMKNEDLPEITEMLKQEGVTDSLDFMDSINTFVLEDNEVIGLLNWKFEHGYPSLRHFCVRKDKRNYRNAKQLFNYYKELMKDFKYSIINADKLYVRTLIEKYFKVKPYAQVDNTYFYLVRL